MITSKPTWKLKHANSILETFEYFRQISSKSIHIISSYTVSMLGRFSETQCSTDIVWWEFSLVKIWKFANPLSHILSDLALQLGLVIHTSAVGLWLQENGNISTLSCITEVYHVTTIRFIAFTVSHIHTVLTEPSTHCQCQEFGTATNSLQSKVILALVVRANQIFNDAVQVNWSCRMCHKNELVIQPRLQPVVRQLTQ